MPGQPERGQPERGQPERGQPERGLPERGLRSAQRAILGAMMTVEALPSPSGASGGRCAGTTAPARTSGTLPAGEGSMDSSRGLLSFPPVLHQNGTDGLTRRDNQGERNVVYRIGRSRMSAAIDGTAIDNGTAGRGGLRRGPARGRDRGRPRRRHLPGRGRAAGGRRAATRSRVDTHVPDHVDDQDAMHRGRAAAGGAGQPRPGRAGRRLLPRVRRDPGADRLRRGHPGAAAAGPPATVKNLVTHTSGLGYWFWSEDLIKWEAVTGIPNVVSGIDRVFTAPMLADPGSGVHLRHQHRLAGQGRRGGHRRRPGRGHQGGHHRPARHGPRPRS